MRRAALILALLFACGEADVAVEDAGAPDAAPTLSLDSGPSADAEAAPWTVEIGTGVDDFIPLMEGDAVEITLGPQGGGVHGGFHIWHAVRTRGFDPRGILLDFRTLRADTEEELASQERRVNLRPVGDTHVAHGIAPWLLECCRAEQTDVLMIVEVTDAAGRTGSDRRRVRAGVCAEPGGGSLCP